MLYRLRHLAATAAVFSLAACGGSDKVTVVEKEPTPEKVILYTEVDQLPVGGVTLRNGEHRVHITTSGLHDLFLVDQGASFAIELDSQPFDSECNIVNGSGVAVGRDIRNISISCIDIDSPPIFYDLDDIKHSYAFNVFQRFNVEDLEEDPITVSLRIDAIPDGAIFSNEPMVTLINNPFDGSTYYELEFKADRPGLYQIMLVATTQTGETEQLFTAELENSSPSIDGFRLVPSDPVATQDLSLQNISIYDDETRDLQPSNIQWFVNDAMVASGADAVTLAANAFVKGDTVRAKLIVTDGVNTVEDERSVVIGDERGTFSFEAMPSFLTEGEALEFDIQWVDPDNDPFPANVTFNGPEGATIDGQGHVVWQTPALQFDSQVYRFSINNNDQSGSGNSAIITLQRPQKSAIVTRTRTTINHSSTFNTLALSNPDDNGMQKIYASNYNSGSSVFSFNYSNDNYTQDWAYPYALNSTNNINDLKVDDINGDAIDDIFIISDRVLIIIDGDTHRVLAQTNFDHTLASMVVADIDNDQQLDIVISTRNEPVLYIVHADDLNTYSEISSPRIGGQIMIGNVDADPALEIITLAGAVYDGVSLKNEWFYAESFGWKMLAGDLDSDGIDEIVAFYHDNSIRIFNAETKALLHTQVLDVCGGDIGNLVGGDEPELVLSLCGFNQGMHAYRWDGTSLSEVWSTSIANISSIRQLQVGNVDDDANAEIVFRYERYPNSGSLSIIDASQPNELQWQDSLWSNFNSGFNAAGVIPDTVDKAIFLNEYYEAPISTESGARVISLTATGDALVSGRLDDFRLRADTMTLADINGDDFPEWVVGFNQRCIGLDAVLQSSLWDSGSLRSGCEKLNAIDLNDDKAQEVSFIHSGVLEIHDTFNDVIVWTSDNNDRVIDYVFANMDGDSDNEIVLSTNSAIKVYNKVQGQYSLLSTIEGPYTLFDSLDSDSDGAEELVIYHRNNRSIQLFELLDSRLEVKKTIPLTQGQYGVRKVVASTDSDGKPSLLLVLPGNSFNSFSIESIAVDSATINWSTPYLIGRADSVTIKPGFTNDNGSKGLLLGTDRALMIIR